MRRNLRYFVATLLVLLTALFSAKPVAVRAATFTVTNLNDSGIGSLRQAISDANASVGPDTITFAVAGTLNILSALPAISDTTGGTVIDGTTAPGYTGVPVVVLKGPGGGTLIDGLTISSANNQIQALQIVSFQRAISIILGEFNVIAGNYIGTDGALAIPNRFDGIAVINAPRNMIGGTSPSARNVISGNGSNGVLIVGALAVGNVLQGNFIGTDAIGTLKIPNVTGVGIDRASGNLVGGTTPAARNIISGNNNYGLVVHLNAFSNSVQGNFIGTDVTGTLALGNNGGGMIIQGSSNTIGGLAAGSQNVISGNSRDGIEISISSGNKVQGNFIGTDVTGRLALGNNGNGVSIISASSTTIGGLAAGSQNVISGNGSDGILLSFRAIGNIIQGNLIGTDVSGTTGLPNGIGIHVTDGSNNTIGGTTPAARNIISANLFDGIRFVREGASGGLFTGNLVQGNYIGTDVSGTLDLGNSGDGVFINFAAGVVIGGLAAGSQNVISGNGRDGIVIASSTGNIVQGNFIGTDATGTLAIANSGDGIDITGAPGNTIGGTTPAARNIISGNSSGLRISGIGARGNFVQGNFIGTDVTGSLALANTGSGIDIIDAPFNTIGGTSPSARNVISGNGSVGVAIFGLLASGNVLQGNFIGTDATGTLKIPNLLHGVQIAAPGNLVGGTTPAARNIISGNRDVGVQIGSANGNGNAVQGNFIGTDVTGTMALGNDGAGVFINTGSSNTIGGLATGSQNVISGNLSANAGHGIVILNASGNSIQGNLIGTDVTGTTGLPNQMGILVNYPNGGSNTTIGGTTAAARNIISASRQDGIRITSINAFTTGDVVQGNYIGTDVTGTLAIANSGSGIGIFGGSGITIARNVISGNKGSGVDIVAPASGNVLQGNFIGTDATGTLKIPNSFSGVVIRAPGNLVGGTTPEARNIISGNLGSGLGISSNGNGNSVQGNFIGTDVTGTQALGNTGNGVAISFGLSNTIGGLAAGSQNVISGNDSEGIVIASSGNIIQGNLIGTDVTGTTGLPNRTGILLNSDFSNTSNNTIGGMTAAARNIISANRSDGITFHFPFGFGSGNLVQGNFIGTDISGTLDLGNGGDGVRINPADGTIIGGNTLAAGNLIAFNQRGVSISHAPPGTFGTNNTSILHNSMRANDFIGIDLPQFFVANANDPGDGDNGANELQNYPVITSAIASPTNTLVAGSLNSAASSTFTLEFFSNSVCSPIGHGEGETFLNSISITTDAAGDASFNLTFPVSIPVGHFITATATGPLGNTSEFSLCFAVILPNQSPSATDDLATTDEDTSVTIPVTANDTDADGNLDPATVSITAAPAHGMALPNGDGTVTYTPNADFNGTNSFPYQVCDTAGACATALVTITITAVNDDPVVGVTHADVTVDEGQTASNDGTVSDLDGDAVTLSASVGSITDSGAGTWSWSYATDDGPTQSATVTISADDGHGGMSQTTFNLIVNNVAPTVNAAPDDFITSGSTFSVNATFTDPGSADTHTATIDFGLGAGPQPATVAQGAGSGTVSGSQTYFTTGSYTITVCVIDDDGGSGCDSLNLQVNTLEVTIDIKPGSPHNRINLHSHGKLSVAILSSATFDASQVDPRSVTLAGAPVIIKPNGKPSAQLKDVNRDGRLDLVVRVQIQDLELTETSTEGILIGMTYGGSAIQGKDKVTIVPARAPELESPVIEQVFTKRTVKLVWVLEDKEEDVVTCYLVQIDNQEDFSSPEQSAVVVGSETYTTTPLPNGYYYWRVSVSDCSTTVISPWSEIWSFIVQAR